MGETANQRKRKTGRECDSAGDGGGACVQPQPFREWLGALQAESYPGNTIEKGRRGNGGQVNRWLTD